MFAKFTLGIIPRRLFIYAASLAVCLPTFAATLKPNPLFSDHAVLQQGKPVPVWGSAEPGADVKVALGEHKAVTKTNTDGKWILELGPLDAGGPYTLTISSGTQQVVAEDVLVGEVWLASGQSNMKWNIGRTHVADEVAARADYPSFRYYDVPGKEAVQPQDELGGKWIVVSPKTAKSLSAVAFYFAESLQAELKVPVGIIKAAVGGSSAETWTPMTAMQSTPSLQQYDKDWRKLLEQYPELANDPKATIQAWNADYDRFQKAIGDYHAGKLDQAPRRETPNVRHAILSGHYNAMINPLIPYAISGVIWYQGEDNSGATDRAMIYADLFATLIQSWRTQWGQPDLPFLFVQLPEFRRGESWWWLRDSQRRAAETLDHTGMFVAIGYGDLNNVHPQKKRAGGTRADPDGHEDGLWRTRRGHGPDSDRH